MTKYVYTDGLKSYDLPMNDPSAWVSYGAPDNPAEIELTKRVGAVSRAQELIANAVANMPFAIMKNGEDWDTSWDWQNKVGFMPRPRDLLKRWRMSWTMTNAAYAFREGKASAFTLQYLSPWTITPLTDNVTGELIGFERKLGTRKEVYPLKDKRIVYLWKLDETTELLPSAHTEFKALMQDAGILYYADYWIKNHFERGGVPPSLVMVKGVTTGTVREELESKFSQWLKRIQHNIAKVVNADAMDVKQLGDGIESIKDTPTFDQSITNICITLGIPVSYFLSDFANRATANTYYAAMYRDKIVPDCNAIAEQLNDQLFTPMGMRFEFRPEMAEPNQDEESDRASAFASYVNAGMPMPIAAQIVGIDMPAGYDYDDLEPEEPEQPEQPEPATEEPPTQAQDDEEDVAEEPTKSALNVSQLRELLVWQEVAERRAKKSKSLDFAYLPHYGGLPVYIVESVSAQLKEAKSLDDVKRVFDSVSTMPPPRYEVEALLNGIRAGVDALKTQPNIIVNVNTPKEKHDPETSA